jgi:amino acid adenylation domain-containing protein
MIESSAAATPAVTPGVLVGPRREWSVPFGLPGLVRASAQRAPDAIALVEDDGGTLTYAELEVESDALAAQLRAVGGQPGGVVAVCLPRGRALVIALLAALKAHMPYLPLSVDDPQRRRDLLLRLSGAGHALVDADTERLLGPRPDLEVIHVELGATSQMSDPASDSWSELVAYSGNQPVYVLFTSGTTGTPKGVVVPSDALVNRLCWMHETFQIRSDDRILQKTPYTFDVSGWELWNPLIAGATMVLLPSGAHRDPGQVVQCIIDKSVTLCHFVPSMLAEFLRWPTAGRCTSLRAVFCSGEELTPGHVRQFRQVLNAELYNLYGPTEAVIDVTYWPCPVEADLPRTLIGGPISNCTLAVLNDDHSPTPYGAVGELAIGGTPLATGYLGEPELTRRAFIDAPPWGPVSRLYLTGDLVRQCPEGLEYLGRRDAQVKIRGQRVELIAVEDALRDLETVVDAAATTVDRGAGQELGALVVLAPAADDLNLVRSGMRQVLPDSHVPTLLFPVADIPLSPSGKLDRRQVREQAATLADSLGCGADTADGDLPARLWYEATGSYPANADVGFLDAGGHSLMAARLVGLVLSHYGVRLPLRELFRTNMSLTGLRTWLDTVAPAPLGAEAPTASASTALFPQQHGLWVWSRLFPKCPAYNVTAVLDLDRRVDVARLERAVNALVRRHPAIRTTFRDTGQDVQRHVHPAEEAGVRVRVGRTDSVVTDVLDHLFVPHLLPRLAVGVRQRAGEWGDTVLLAIDHLVADQRSLDLVLAELAELYAGRQPADSPVSDTGVTPPTPERRELDLAFWRDRLQDAPQALNLPWQRQRPRVPSFRGASLDVELGADGSSLVERFCARTRVTPFVFVLTVFARRLGRWAGVDDLVVGVPMTGRESPAEQDAIGFFVRTLPVRLRVAAGQQVEAAVEAGAEALFEATEHAAVSFEEIVEHLGGSRDLAHNPVFRVWCNDISHEEPPASFGEATATLVHPPARWSLFDLNLYLYLCRGEAGTLRLVYSTDLWDEDTAAAFVRQCRDDLLRAADPTRVEPTAVMDAIDQAARVDGPRRTCADLVDAVLAHAHATPDRVAITGGGRRITFGQLRHRILQVSAAVRVRSDEQPAVVGVLARRHADLAPAILGCWHAGAAPLLLDADAPQRWRSDALHAASAAVLLDVAPEDDVAPEGIDGDALWLTDEWWATTVAADTPTHRPDPDRIGHVLLTSGTIGGPAVVALPADALPAAFDGYRDALSLTANDVFAFTVPPDHDPVFRDLVLPLVMGAAVHVATSGEHHQRGMVPWLDEIGATVLHTTPSQATLLAAAHPDRVLRSLRRVVFHGDVLCYSTVAAMRRLAPEAQIYNLYGTTETPQASGLRRIEPTERGSAGDAVPIAASAPHRKLVVLGPEASSNEIGVLGEIAVTGTGLTLGDLGENDGDTGRRHCYRTGDLGRLRADGLIELVGRADRQVSVRGHRVQLDSVEAVLREVRGVRNCHVAVEPGTARLIAWWSGAAELGAAEIASALRAQLPAAAVPAQIRRIAAIPLTARGKVNTDALMRASAEQDMAARPTAGGEPLLDLVLRRVTEQQPSLALGPDDNFFDAGLTSLNLLRLYESVRAELGATVTIADFFRFSTARRLFEHAVGAKTTAHRIPSRRRKRGDFADELRLRRAVRQIAAMSLEKGY